MTIIRFLFPTMTLSNQSSSIPKSSNTFGFSCCGNEDVCLNRCRAFVGLWLPMMISGKRQDPDHLDNWLKLNFKIDAFNWRYWEMQRSFLQSVRHWLAPLRDQIVFFPHIVYKYFFLKKKILVFYKLPCVSCSW